MRRRGFLLPEGGAVFAGEIAPVLVHEHLSVQRWN
jgi:hypothetical protein